MDDIEKRLTGIIAQDTTGTINRAITASVANSSIDNALAASNIDDIIEMMKKHMEIEGKLIKQREFEETKDSYEERRSEHFKKFPALKEAWDQYQMVERLYIGKGKEW